MFNRLANFTLDESDAFEIDLERPATFAYRYIRPDDRRIIFQGLNETEFLEFVHAVFNKGMEQGKPGNDAWLANYAATCFVAGALRWYLRLPKDVRRSWDLLLEALMEKYSEAVRDIPPSPAPAAAPPAQTTPNNAYPGLARRRGL